MKKQILMIIFGVSIWLQPKAQIRDTTPKAINICRANYYLEKTRSLRTGATMLLMIGTTSMVGGAVGISHHLESSDPYAELFVFGAAAALGSIPLYIAAHRNMKKAAAELRIGFEPLSMVVPGRKSATGLGLEINFK